VLSLVVTGNPCDPFSALLCMPNPAPYLNSICGGACMVAVIKISLYFRSYSKLRTRAAPSVVLCAEASAYSRTLGLCVSSFSSNPCRGKEMHRPKGGTRNEGNAPPLEGSIRG